MSDIEYLYSEEAWERIAELRAELVNALAACKVKDEALEKACNRIEEYGFEIGEYWRTGRDALAIQPDDAALKAWLGEPACFVTPDGDGWRMRFDPPVSNVPLGWTPLYSPKGLK